MHILLLFIAKFTEITGMVFYVIPSTNKTVKCIYH